MGMVCDVCETKFGHDACHANLRVTPPRPDFKLFQALAAAGQPYESAEPLALDLCVECTKKVLLTLGLPIDGCELPQLPEPPKADKVDAEPAPNAGALTEEELRKLGMTDDDLRQLGLTPTPRVHGVLTPNGDDPG
jgi:hypothetical protein